MEYLFYFSSIRRYLWANIFLSYQQNYYRKCYVLEAYADRLHRATLPESCIDRCIFFFFFKFSPNNTEKYRVDSSRFFVPKTTHLFMEKLLICVYSIGVFVRAYLSLSDFSASIADRVEVSTPLNSWKRGSESVILCCR